MKNATLGEMMDLKRGDCFLFRGNPAVCIWRDYVRELVAKGVSILNSRYSENWTEQFTLFFVYGENRKPVTLRSSWRSRDLVMPDFALDDGTVVREWPDAGAEGIPQSTESSLVLSGTTT